MEMNKKNMITIGLVTFATVVVLVIIIAIFAKKSNPPVVPKNSDAPVVDSGEFNPNHLSEIVGRVKKVSLESIEIITDQEKILTLNIPKEGASFLKEVEQRGDKFLIKKIGLFDIPIEGEVDVRYNNETNELLMVVVKL